MYSDSLIESVMGDGNALEAEGLKKFILKYSQTDSASRWVDNLVREFRHCLAEETLLDDLTLLMVKRKSG
jgi:serine phosphatase RsbU (regulator of sigma subunit)